MNRNTSTDVAFHLGFEYGQGFLKRKKVGSSYSSSNVLRFIEIGGFGSLHVLEDNISINFEMDLLSIHKPLSYHLTGDFRE